MKEEHDEIASSKREENYSKQWFIRALKLLKQEKIKFENVIDIGAGKGEFLEILKDNFSGLNTVGVDYTETNLKSLESKDIQTLKIDLENFNLKDYKDLRSKFDLVICLETIEHVFNADRLFKFFSWLLKEDGYLLISTPNMAAFQFKLFYLLRGYPLGENHHIRFFNKKKLQQYAFFNGFDLVKWNNYFSFQLDIIKRGFGVRNKFLVYLLSLLLFGPLFVLHKLNLFDSLVNTNLVVLFKKSHFIPLGIEIENFKSNFEKLSDKELWINRIKRYYKKDKLREFVYFRSYIKKIIRK